MKNQNIESSSDEDDRYFLRNFIHFQENPMLQKQFSNQIPSNSVRGNPQQLLKDLKIEESECQRQIGKSKEKKKAFYRDKLAGLLKPGQFTTQQYNYSINNNSESDKQPISKQEQLKRNRESAKNSRLRKKEYVTVLEQKNSENMKLIQELTYKLQKVTRERDSLKEQNRQQIKNFLKSKAQAYQNLEKILKNPYSSDSLIKEQIDWMLEKFSISGSQRVAVMNYYMNQIIEELISDIHKYFLTSTAFNIGFTAYIPLKPIDQEVIKILDLDIPKMSQLTQKYKQRFNRQASVFKTLTQEFYRVFKSIQNQSRVIEQVFIDMSKEIDTRRLGDLIVWFQENQFCREVKRVRVEWIQQLKTGEETIEVIRKQTKHN